MGNYLCREQPDLYEFEALPIAITKVENKGKQNRRVRIELVPPRGAG